MGIIFRLLTSVRELWGAYIAIVVLAVLTALTGLLTPFLIKMATDEVVAATNGGPQNFSKVLWIAGALLAADLANTFITNIGGYLGDTTATRLRAALSSRYYEHLLRLPQSYFDKELTGTVISRLTRSITETTQFLNGFANNFFPMLVTLVATLGVSAYYSWPLALLLLIIYPVFMWLTTITSKKWQVLEGLKNTESDLAGGRFAEVIGQIKVVKSFARERGELAAFDGRFDTTVNLTREQSRYWHTMDISRRAALNVIFFGVYAILFVQTMRGDYSLGVMVLLLQLVAMARMPVMMMSFLVDAAQRAIAGSRDYFAVLDEPVEVGRGPVRAAEVIEHPEIEPTRPDAPVVEFDNVTFRYADGPVVLDQVSFSAGRGERLAFVGESGGGKTTIVSALLGLYPVSSGSVRLLGHDISTLPPEQVRQLVGVVFQDPSLFSGTVQENLAYGRPDAGELEVVAAAKDANAHTFIKSFSEGYDTVIGERGLRLSGGQKQRIAVGRAILKDAPILVLDEATSALDSKAERLVQEGLDRLMHGRTTLIIAHRLSTIASVDRIVTLDRGRVDEIGTPEELAQSGGIYAELLHLQASASKRDRKRLREFGITA